MKKQECGSEGVPGLRSLKGQNEKLVKHVLVNHVLVNHVDESLGGDSRTTLAVGRPSGWK